MSLTASLRFILLALLVTATLAHASAWTPVGPFRVTQPVLAFAPGAPNTLIVSAANAVVRSTDGGNTFDLVAGLSGFTAFAASGPDANVIYGFGSASDSAGVSKSVDDGQTWQVVNPMPATTGTLIVVAPTNPNIIYNAGGSGGVIRSTNGGVSFSARSTNLQALPAMSLAVSPADENVVYAGSIGPLFKSTDGGITFAEIGPPGVFRGRAVAVDPRNAATVYCVLSDGVYKSSDSGASFAKLAVAVAPWTGSSGSLVSDATIAIDPG